MNPTTTSPNHSGFQKAQKFVKILIFAILILANVWVWSDIFGGCQNALFNSPAEKRNGECIVGLL
jgi:hypothetical protein